jgi:group I intron endonuclease
MKYINDPGVYIIENIKTGAFYIGSSHLVKHRINKHKTELRQNVHGNKKLQKDWNKFGENSFTFTMIKPVDDGPSIRLQYEQIIFNEYKKSGREYYNIKENICGRIILETIV